MAVDTVKAKVLLLGEGAVGKTSLIRRFVIDRFGDEYIATIGTKVTKKDMDFQVGPETKALSLMIWDVLGQQGFTGIQESAFRGARGALFIYDLSRPDTMKALEDYWLPKFRQVAGDVPVVIVGNKVDLAKNRSDEQTKLDVFSVRHGTIGFLSSAKTGENVESAFRKLGRGMLARSEKVDETEVIEVTAVKEGGETVVAVADRIITDFCREYGNLDAGMTIVRQQFTRADVDIRHPTTTGLRKAVDYLAEVERGYKGEAKANENRNRRLLWLREVSAAA